MEKIWEIKDPDSYLKRHRKQNPRNGLPSVQRNPARAYTLSLLLWGAGQSYNGEYGIALAFRLVLIGLGVFTVVTGIFRDDVLFFLQSRYLVSQVFLCAEISIFSLFAVWVNLAADAYRGAARSRSKPYTGSDSRVLPFLCSLFVPGWGQFLNGQPVKGSIFSVFAAIAFFSLVSIPAVLLAWPFLEPDACRGAIEDIFFVTVLAVPLIPILWLFNIHDALVVSLDDYRKEPLWERIKAANNRRRNKGLVQGVTPWIGRTILLVLVLVLCVIALQRNFSAGFYGQKLTSLQQELARSGMTLVPEFIGRMLALLSLR